ncbi:MAG: hypothetical protein V1900_01360 [Candidatus Aenigmatarchaeota archaeon]
MIEYTLPVLVLFVLFMLFILMVKSVLKLLVNALIIIFASAIFPVIVNFLGFPVEISINNILFFIMIGFGSYVVYLFARIVYNALGAVESAASGRSRSKKRSKD